MSSFRTQQIGALKQAFQASASELQLRLINGEVGMGKSFLIESFLQNISSEEDILVAKAICNYQTGKYEPYLPIKDLLKELLHLSEHLHKEVTSPKDAQFLVHTIQLLLSHAPDLIATFIPLESILEKLNSYEVADETLEHKVKAIAEENSKEDFQIDEHKVHHQVINLIKEINQHYQLVLVLEDLQWIDRASANLLLPIIQRLEENSILIIFSCIKETIYGSDHFLEPVLNEIIRKKEDVEISLDLKEEQDKQTFLKELLDEIPNNFDEVFRSQLLKLTNANPLFVLEFMHTLEHNQQIYKDDQGVLIASENLNWNNVPEKLEAVILARLDKLDDQMNELLSFASVQGNKFLMQVISRINEQDDRDLIKLLKNTLIKEHKLIKSGETKRLNKQRLFYFYFNNGLLQSYLYNNLIEGEKIQFHEDVATILEEIYASHTEGAAAVIAYHYELAQMPEKALLFYEKAGENSLKISAFQEACLIYGKAESLVEELIQEDEHQWKSTKLRILVKHSIALKPIAGWVNERVIDLYTRAFELGLQLENHETIAPVTFGLWVKHLFFLELKEALTYAEQFYKSAFQLEDSSMLVKANICLSNTYFWMGQAQKALQYAQYAEEVLSDFEVKENEALTLEFGQHPKSLALLFNMLSLSLLGKSDEAYALADSSLKWIKNIDHPFTEAIVLQALAWMYFQENDLENANTVSEDLISLSEKHNFQFYLGMAQLFKGAYLIEKQKIEEGLLLLEEGYQTNIIKDGGYLCQSIYNWIKVKGLVGQKKWQEALEVVDQAIIFSEEREELVYLPPLMSLKARILENTNQSDLGKALKTKVQALAKESSAILWLRYIAIK